MCGASESSLDSNCSHCGAVLATVACPSCFGMVFQGSEFCSHCGSKIEGVDLQAMARCQCPRCHVQLQLATIGQTQLAECANCHGLWVDHETANRIYAEKEKQCAVMGMTLESSEPQEEVPDSIRYLFCPMCKELMNRVNFAQCSGIIVDVCKAHGTWFDKDELRRIVEFIRSGGLDKSRQMEMLKLASQRRALELQQNSQSAPLLDRQTQDKSDFAVDLGVGLVELLISLLK